MAELVLECLIHLIAWLLAAAWEGCERCWEWLTRGKRVAAPAPSTSALEAPRRARVPAGFVVTQQGYGQRCPYCHDDLEGRLLACETCATPLHAECCRELGRCTTIGCGGRSELGESSLEIHLRPRPSVGSLRARALRIKTLRARGPAVPVIGAREGVQ